MTTRWKAGDFVLVDINPQAGHEQAGRRPALVISEAAYNARARLAVVCPITTQSKGYPFEVPIPDGHSITGVVLADHVKSLDLNARKAKLVGHAPRLVLDTARQYVALILGIAE